MVIVKGQQTIHHANISSPENKSISGTMLAWLGELSSLLSFLLDSPTSSFFVKGEKFGTTCSKGKNMLRYYLYITCYPLSDTLYVIDYKYTYSRTPLFRTRLIRSPRYFEGRSNFLDLPLCFQSFTISYFELDYFEFPAISNSPFVQPRYFELVKNRVRT